MNRSRFFLLILAVVLVASAGEAVAPSAAMGRGYSRDDLRLILRDVSFEYGVDPSLMEALVSVESAFNPYAVSHKGAMGLMQLMPATARRLDVQDPFDPVQNIRGGVREFSRLVDRYAGNLALALAAYNAGEGAVAKYRGVPPYRETRRYVSKIMEMYTGHPYRLSGGVKKASRVRLLRTGEAGQVLITNTTGSSRIQVGSSGPSDGALGGGFGR